MGHRRPEPRPLRSVLTAVLESLRLGDPAEAALFDRWNEAAGKDFAARCRPEQLEDGRLTVVCEHPVLSYEIGMQREALLARVNAFLKGRVVTELRVHLRKPHGR